MAGLPVHWLLPFLVVVSCTLAGTGHPIPFEQKSKPEPPGAWTRFAYSVHGLDTLFLEVKTAPQGDRAPGVIFIHGGGFSSGTMDAGPHVDLLDTLVAHGITCTRISYRLSMADRGFGCDVPSAEKQAAVMLANQDLTAAIHWLKQSELKLPGEWVAMGSSAGGETAMWAAYGDRMLPWAGVAAFSGAIVDSILPRHDAPPFFGVHGTCDGIVPSGQSVHRGCAPEDPGAWMLCGSLCWGERMTEAGLPSLTRACCGEDHAVCNSAMLDPEIQAELISWLLSPEVRSRSNRRIKLDGSSVFVDEPQGCPSPCQ